MHHRSNLARAFVRAPLFRAVLPFTAGLVAGRFLPVPLAWAWSLLVLSAGVWAYCSFRRQHYGLRWATGLSLLALLLLFGVLWQRLHAVTLRHDHVGQYAARASGWDVAVKEIASVGARTVRVWVEVKAAVVDSAVLPASGRMLVTLMHDSTLGDPQVGDQLLLDGKAVPIDRVPDPGGFDVRAWAASRGAFHECFAPVGRWAVLKAKRGGPDFYARARKRIAQWLHNSGLPDRERALAKAVLLGLRDELEPEQNQAFIRSGTIHTLAVSGSHVGIIYIAVLWALSFMGKGLRSRLVRGVLILAALWLYAGLTGYSPSVLRATLMFSLFTIAESTRWRSSSLNSLACAAALLLLWDPSLLVQLGFQLSFLAVLGIIAFYRPLHQAWAPSTMAGRFFWSLMAVSLAAQVFTFPLCLYVFNAFPIWFLPANMAIVGIVGLGVYGGMLLLLLHGVPVLGAFMAASMTWLLLLLGWLSAFFSSLPGAYPAVRIGFVGMVGLYALVAFAALWIMLHKRWARLAALATLALLLFGWAGTARKRNQQRQFAVYGDREGLTCAVVQGRTMHVYSDHASKWTERSIRQHARQAGVQRVVRTDSIPQWIDVQGGPIGFLNLGDDGAGEWPGVPRTIILHGEGWLDKDRLKRMAPAQWVLGGDVSGYARRIMERHGKDFSQAVHDLRRAGAYVRP